MDDSTAEEKGIQPQSVSDLEEIDSADTPGCSNGESPTLDADTRMKQLTSVHSPLRKLNEHLQEEIKFS